MKEFTQAEIKALKEIAQERIVIDKILDNTEYNKKVAKSPERVCDFLGDGRCASNYGDDMKCDGIHTPDKCPYKDRGSFAMVVHDQGNRRKNR